ncbi:MAG TPA: glycosyltransferase family 39 protein [Thermoanaerobaculaceae bacterium]|nr:glycosyltransferase family 39 protein [Thermoanaerobaculaceae bacterium]
MSAKERTVALILLGGATLLRVPYILHYRVNSDEPQHLHVVWGWTAGLLQYRDLSDNHPPLFHLLMAPLLALVGERPDAVIVMRGAMVPLALAAIWLTYTIASRLYGGRAAFWAAVLLALHYEFFFKSIEFRTDNLWTVGWLAALALAAGAPATGSRAFLAGAALGADACVSQKTALMVAALASAGAVVAVVSPAARRAVGRTRTLRLAAAAALGFALLPIAIASYFASRGALPALARSVLTQNLVPGLGTWGEAWRRALLPAGAALAIWIAVAALRSTGSDGRGIRRALVALTGVAYVVILEGAWPLVTGQDYLPVFPLAAVFAAAGLETWRRRTAGVRAPAAVLAVFLAAESAVIVFKGPIWRDRAAPQTALVADVLRLTDRDEFVMDTKGETIFRKRPFFPVLETITIERLRRGLIPDTVAGDVVRAGCLVAVPDSARFPAVGRDFLNRNFVPAGSLRVAGQFLAVPRVPGGSVTFEVAVAGRFAVVAPSGPAAGSLDGTPYAGPRDLAAGPHAFAPQAGSPLLAVVWARAVERGYSPFAAGGGAS